MEMDELGARVAQRRTEAGRETERERPESVVKLGRIRVPPSWVSHTEHPDARGECALFMRERQDDRRDPASSRGKQPREMGDFQGAVSDLSWPTTPWYGECSVRSIATPSERR